MRYALARYKEFTRERAYRVYVTDCLRAIAENTANFAGGNYITNRFADACIKVKAVDNRTGEEIAADVIKRTGLVVRK